MIRSRNTPDGLPFRVYERYGARVYSIGYKLRSGRWAFKLRCPVDDAPQIQRLRRDAIAESARVIEDIPEGGFCGLVEAWFERQEALPVGSAKKRAASTIAENRREADMLKADWADFNVDEITRTMGYDYLESYEHTRPEKANKEIALARLILEYGIRKGMIEVNPLDGITKNKRVKTAKRYVSDDEMECAVIAGRWMGGGYHIIAMALRTAWLCVRRSVEVRAIGRDSITDTGIVWTDSKDPNKPKILIEWSPELRDTINEALAIERNSLAGSFLIFGNLQGQKYTKTGWGKMLRTLMACAGDIAEIFEVPFQPFSLQDCRPKGVSDKLAAGHTDTQDATLHSDGKMIARIYDRRANKKATPAG